MQSSYSPFLKNRKKKKGKENKKRKKKQVEGKETWEKVQSNSVTLKSKKAEIVTFSIEKMKVKKKELCS